VTDEVERRAQEQGEEYIAFLGSDAVEHIEAPLWAYVRTHLSMLAHAVNKEVQRI
jgi:hypothetical protein